MEEKNIKKGMPEGVLKEMLDAGVHIGHSKSKGHPKMKPYIFMTRQGVQIINVEKTAQKLQEAADFLKDTASRGGIILFVATTMPAKPVVKEAASALSMPYVSERWLGGTLTNFKSLSKRLEYFIKQEDKKAKGEFAKYSKKEQAMFAKELEDLEVKMGGIKNLKKHPDVIFLVDIDEHKTTIKEAKANNIPIVALSDTNTDPSLVNYIIPANDRSVKSISIVLNGIQKAVKDGIEASKSNKNLEKKEEGAKKESKPENNNKEAKK
jgi:small subunit ribosomal protein S2